MFDIILDNFRIPWLIWIQIFIMFLLTLIILFCYFGFIVLDSSLTTNSHTTISPNLKISHSCSPSTQVRISPAFFVSSSPSTQATVNHDAREEIATTASNRLRRLENNSERDGSSIKDIAPSPVAERFFHPCRYLDLARQAFLKCLGLGSGSHNCNDEEHEHED
ncbi:uncharacterized protein LOC104896089 isoform X1 [Beta vulgaris subsp. vulgaris]|uniref:uncharacterized protein LOC104896089 isoform X1 n=1 Tax=Beta vulgaris subsp. vulgaris TaxID=3555 RepID=UPI002036C5B4|nr:uncharacterized protein LOC104896089 isoform X1 [Beta vulgaris subsp. vulgaris]